MNKQQRESDDKAFLKRVSEGAKGLSGKKLDEHLQKAYAEESRRPNVMPGDVRRAVRKGSEG